MPVIQHEFATILLQWFSQHGRSLPWRETKDPYAIWLSEVILQQTRIAQGLPYWQRFMQHFPTVEHLAKANEDEVLRLWQGLGYYSRARNLHTAAKQIVEMGDFPNTFEKIKQLKGVGQYTASAIASIAFDLPHAVVDGNVYRVLSRYFGISTPINSTEGQKEFALLAQALLPPHVASLYNQAIMDFGAIQCVPAVGTKNSPKNTKELYENIETLSPTICDKCLLQIGCVAYREGKVRELPIKLKNIKIKTRYLNYVYIRCGNEIAIHRRPSADIWEGLWEPYLVETHSSQGITTTDLAPLFPHGTQHSIPFPTLIRSGVKHVLTHRILLANFYLLTLNSKPVLPADFIWIKEEDIEQYAVPRLIEILLEHIR